MPALSLLLTASLPSPQVYETSDVTGTQVEHAWVVKLTPLPAGGVAEGGKKKKLSKADEVGCTTGRVMLGRARTPSHT